MLKKPFYLQLHLSEHNFDISQLHSKKFHMWSKLLWETIKKANICTFKFHNLCKIYTWNITYFLLSPTSIALLMNGSFFLMASSIITGGIFSPPAVITNSFSLPVMNKNPFSSNLPISPVWSQPSSSIWN